MQPHELSKKIFVRRDILNGNTNEQLDIQSANFFQVCIRQFNLDSEEFVVIQV